MKFRKYGVSPITVVLVHGGPGAPGEMKPIAEELANEFGLLEPLQTENSVQRQIEELKKVIEKNASYPVYLIGWSWGAWLSYLLTAQFPKLIKKLILVSSGPFEASYADQIMKTRLERLSIQEKNRVKEIISLLQDEKANDEVFKEFGSLMDKADSFHPIPHEEKDDLDMSEFGSNIYERVWPEAAEMRKSGKLIEEGKKITCPVVAIQGDYDSHPSEGVNKPLSKVLKDFRFILLKNCGHHPWYEMDAKDNFYEIIRKELR
jgi:pimeloyl-ACP methyl ester carboxylesterase